MKEQWAAVNEQTSGGVYKSQTAYVFISFFVTHNYCPSVGRMYTVQTSR